MNAFQDKRVLVVDDDRVLAELLTTRLMVLGCHVRTAHDGLAATASIKDFRPEAMVLDISMPMMDGFEVMARLGADKMRRLPTLVLTARHTGDDVRRAIALGARDFLAKPFEEAKLVARVGRLLGPATIRSRITLA